MDEREQVQGELCLKTDRVKIKVRSKCVESRRIGRHTEDSNTDDAEESEATTSGASGIKQSAIFEQAGGWMTGV